MLSLKKIISLILTALRSLAAMVQMALVDQQPAVLTVHPWLPDLLAYHVKHAFARSNTAYFL